MPEDKTPVEKALDLWLYAPIGLALVVRDELPRLVERGRQQVSGQVALARMVGEFAVTQGQKELEKRLDRFVQQAGETAGLASPVTPPAPAAPPPAATASNGSLNGAQTSGAAGAVRAAGTATVTGRPAPPDVRSEELAIPGYDTLSASQVVQRLAGLTPEELDAVRRYETGTRGRRTILAKVSQLQTGS